MFTTNKQRNNLPLYRLSINLNQIHPLADSIRILDGDIIGRSTEKTFNVERLPI